MAGYHLCTLLRQDPVSLLFLQVGIPGSLVCDIQDTGADAPPTAGEKYILPGNPFSKHRIFCYAVNPNVMPPPDVREGDTIVDPQDIDDATGLPSSYICLYVTEWSWHSEIDGRKPVRPPNIVAVNAQILAAYNQTAVLRARVTEATPGATPSASFDPYRQQVTSLYDGSHGVGWTGGGRTDGYLPPATITVGVNDHHVLEQFDAQGRIVYEVPAVYYQRPTVLKQADVLILSDGRRFRVGDDLTPIQVYGQTVLSMAQLEAPQSTNDIIFTLAST